MEEREPVKFGTVSQRLNAGVLIYMDGYYTKNASESEIPGELVQCIHRWIIETPNGPVAAGRCKTCGTTKSFRTSGLPLKRRLAKIDSTKNSGTINTPRLADYALFKQNGIDKLPSEVPNVDPDFNNTPIPD